MRHEVIKKFLLFLGIREKVADEDACMIEHSLHPETVERLKVFMELAQTGPDDPCWILKLKHYLDTGEISDPECDQMRRR